MNTTKTTTVSLTKTQMEIIAKLSPALREQATKDLIAENEKAAALRGVQWQSFQAKANAARQQPFRAVVSPKGCMVVYGLGGRFPVSLFRGQFETLVAHLEELKAIAATLPAKKVEDKK